MEPQRREDAEADLNKITEKTSGADTEIHPAPFVYYTIRHFISEFLRLCASAADRPVTYVYYSISYVTSNLYVSTPRR